MRYSEEMAKKKALKKTRCVGCQELVVSTVGGRCPSCLSVAAALSGDWAAFTQLVRLFKRVDGVSLGCFVQPSSEKRGWSAAAIETPGANLDQVLGAHSPGHWALCRFAFGDGRSRVVCARVARAARAA